MKKITKTILLLLCSFTAFSQCWKSVSAGGYGYVVAIKTDGSLWGWGFNGTGALGDGTYVSKNAPTQIGTANNWLSISAGEAHSVAIKTDGSLWTWGENYWGELGDGTNIDKNVPVQIGTANDWQSISAGEHHVAAIKTNGTLWTWGKNSSGQLGDGSNNDENVPTQIGTAVNWKSVSAGSEITLAIKTDGSLWAWGNNAEGELGDGTFTDKNVPTQIGTANNWRDISVGSGMCLAIKTDGNLWAWGLNFDGRLGDGTLVDKNVPVQIGTANNWLSISAGKSNDPKAIKTDGSLWSWGDNTYGQLGDGSNNNKITPIALACPVTSLGVNSFIYKEKAVSVFPNPSSSNVTVNYSLPAQSAAIIDLYNVMGEKVKSICNKMQPAGTYNLQIDVSDLSAGIYFIKGNFGDAMFNEKLIIQ